MSELEQTKSDIQKPQSGESEPKPLSSRLGRWLKRVGVVIVCLVALASGSAYMLRGPADSPAVQLTWGVESKESGQSTQASSGFEARTLKVMSLNLAHGRAAGFHQALTRRTKIRENLDAVKALLAREQIDAVAVQEADGPSWWSGRFDHVEYLLTAEQLKSAVRGEHVRGAGLRYGTGVVARSQLSKSRTVSFSPSPPTLPKGFVMAQCNWNSKPITLVSVHLDFAAPWVRARQAKRLITMIQRYREDNPGSLVVMGDFNATWEQQAVVPEVCNKLNLKAYQKKSEPTFLTLGKRIDWILISDDLEFASYQVLKDTVSDHQPVLAEIRRTQQ